MNKVEQLFIEKNVTTIGTPPENLRDLFPEGSMLMDVRYYKSPEQFEVVYIDPRTHSLEVMYLPAIVDIYFLHEQYRYIDKDFCVDPYFKNKMREPHTGDEAYQMSQMEIEKVFRVYCKFSQIPAMIKKYAGNARMYSEDGSHLIDMTYEEYYEDNLDSLYNFDFIRRMNQNPWTFKSDFQPDVYFRIRWMHEFGEDIDLSKVTSAYLDIEIDVIDKSVDPKNHEDVTQPVNVVTVIFPAQETVLVTILEPRPKEQLAEKFHPLLEKQQTEYDWIYNNQDAFIDMIRGEPSPPDCPVTVEADDDNRKYIKDYKIILKFFDFHREIDLIACVFAYINKYKPMFVFSWNAPFDHNYLMNRPKWLGYDPASMMIPESFKTCRLDYVEDKTGNFQIKTSRDFFYTSTYSQYMCQMRLYAGIRKSQQEEPSYGLDAIGGKVAGIHKLTNSKSGLFREFAYTNFLLFTLYNIRDVVCQQAIDNKSRDSQTLYARSYDFTTSFAKCFQETHIVRNAKESLYETFGYVMSNKAVVDKTIDGAFQGAYVADPHLNAPTGLILSGHKPNNIIFGAGDLDATAMYPHQKILYGLDKMGMLYKCKIDNDLFRNKQCNNRSYNQELIWHDSKNKPHEVDLAGPIINSYKNKNRFSLLSNYFNIPTITDVILQMKRTLR